MERQRVSPALAPSHDRLNADDTFNERELILSLLSDEIRAISAFRPTYLEEIRTVDELGLKQNDLLMLSIVSEHIITGIKPI